MEMGLKNQRKECKRENNAELTCEHNVHIALPQCLKGKRK